MFERIRVLCVENGLTVTELCKQLTGSSGNLPTWKKGNIKADTLCKIADYFNVSTDYLMGRTDEPIANTKHDTQFTIGGHVMNGDNGVQNIKDSPVTNYPVRPETKPQDDMTSDFLKAFETLDWTDKLDIMQLTREKMKKGA